MAKNSRPHYSRVFHSSWHLSVRLFHLTFEPHLTILSQKFNFMLRIIPIYNLIS